MTAKLIYLLAQTAPLVIAACAALVSEYAGLLNVGIEGLMLFGAFTGISGILLSGDIGGLAPALAVSLLLGAGFSMLITYLSLSRKANIYILGLAINLVAAGFVSILSTRLFGNRSIVSLPPELLPQPQLIKTVSALLTVLITSGLVLFCRYTKPGLALVLAYAGGRSVIGTASAALLFVYLENSIAAAQIGMDHPAMLIGLPFVLGLFLIIAEKLIMRIWKKDL